MAIRYIDGETEEENHFLADVYFYMKEHGVTMEEAEKEIIKLYPNLR